MKSKSNFLRQQFLANTSTKAKQTICASLETVLKNYLTSGKSVYLETFGILIPTSRKIQEPLTSSNKNLLRFSIVRSVEFQKCAELTSYHREKFPGAIELPSLARALFAILPSKYLTLWNLNSIRNLIRGLIECIKYETIVSGRSERLKNIGDFLSLHNRQGETFSDWFAGADIFLNSKFESILESEACITYERPIVENAWEICQSLYGKPIHIFTLPVKNELSKLGYEITPELLVATESQIKVAVFEVKVGQSHHLIYCTDGMRLFGLTGPFKKESNIQYGNELTLQLAYDNDFRESSKDNPARHDDLHLPNWPKQILCLAWILMYGSRTKTIKIGAGLSTGQSFCGQSFDSRLSTILTTTFSKTTSEILSPQGPFHYLNITAITDDEAAFAEEKGPHRLIALLSHKKLDQVIKIGRKSILTRTSFALKSAEKTHKKNESSIRSEKGDISQLSSTFDSTYGTDSHQMAEV